MIKATKNHFRPKKKIKTDRPNLSEEESNDKAEEEEKEEQKQE